jgi:hypothetical protein
MKVGDRPASASCYLSSEAGLESSRALPLEKLPGVQTSFLSHLLTERTIIPYRRVLSNAGADI